MAGCILLAGHAVVLAKLGTTWRGAFLSNVIQLAMMVTLVMAAARAARRSDAWGRHFWQLTAFSYTLLALAQAQCTFDGAAYGGELTHWWTIVLFSLWFVPLGMSLFLDPDAEPHGSDWQVVLDFLQAIIFWAAAYIYFFEVPKDYWPGMGLSELVWARYFLYYGILTAAFFLRSALARPGSARALYWRAGLILSMSAVADAAYYYGPGKDLPTGAWFDFVWSTLVFVPLVIAGVWARHETRPAAESHPVRPHHRMMQQIFPLLYPALILVMAGRIAEQHLMFAWILVLLSFACSSTRLLVTQHRLLQVQDALRREATHDGLTAIWNRIAILETLNRELQRTQRNGTSVGVIMVDVDHFKLINDNYGHAAGDAALRTLAAEISAALRPYDSVGRYGGEEFLIVAPGCGLLEVWELGERIRVRIANHPLSIGDDRIAVTLSMGVATGSAGADVEGILHRADEALYAAKTAGRNRVEAQLDAGVVKPHTAKVLRAIPTATGK